MKFLKCLIAVAFTLAPLPDVNAAGWLPLVQSAGGGCASTGIFDLSNTCNDIYFIGALQ